MEKILVIWSHGMLAKDLIPLIAKDFDSIQADKDECDICNFEATQAFIRTTKPDIILNLAAYTNVEDAEDVWNKVNYDVNALAVYYLAKIAKENDIDFITISTDYVFDGSKKQWWTEDDIASPINQYGMAKYLGEQLVRRENEKSIIIRTSRLYWWGKEFNNFINTIIRLTQTKEEIKIVNDQFGSPTYTIDLSEAIIKVIKERGQYRGRILHCTNTTRDTGISWFEFTQEICKVAGVKITVTPCSSTEFVTKAKRPQCSKLLNNSDIQLRNWEDGVGEYLKRIA